MSVSTDTAERVVSAYTDAQDHWQVEHADGMAVGSLERFIELGLLAYDFILDADLEWNEAIAAGQSEFDEPVRVAILDLLRLWLDRSRSLLATVETFEQRGFKLEGAVRLRESIQSAEGMLTPDDQFFAHDKLTQLQDEAIDEFGRGECLEFE